MNQAATTAAASEPRHKAILRLALPIMGGMVSQNIMNLVDTGMVGSLGKDALAAVGLSSFATFMSQAFIMGLSSGVQAMAARRLGEGKEGDMAIPLNGGLLLAILLGVPMTLILYYAAPALYPYLISDPNVIAEGVPYWRIRLIASTAVGMNFAFRGYLNGVNLSHLYLRSLLVMHACNLVLNYTLIYGKFGAPALGATGAAIGTTTATFVGTFTYCFLSWKHARKAGFLRGLPDRETVRTMLRLSLPSGVRQMFFAAGLTALFWIIGLVSTQALAASNVMINLMLVAILPAMGLGMAAASLVGQALGRHDAEDAKRWGWDVVKIACVLLLFIGSPLVLMPETLLAIFLPNDPDVVALGATPLRVIGGVIAFDGIALVLQNAMLGAGDSKRVMWVGIGLQWLLFLPTAYLVGPHLEYGLVGIWCAFGVHRLIQAGTFAVMWQGGKWAEVRV